ncbi:beta/alpha barrel domain-containing protein [Anaerosinus massiliensis]|uniref:bifunctional 2-keto-4-hydroxyglutarate aldolase/2-keto-3-deoxy-6-phosphogluconate aldolase n=1 Tax=Massilibacillus massiliensis TaxID=1806837 RepID=UPI000AF2B542|nr:bifunctional 2-keto-4-hydroxyglutarate aldolase/2-keto-3-deoxy-6-phosphogluconate aldolase [Massilibacillus massiliensis]
MDKLDSLLQLKKDKLVSVIRTDADSALKKIDAIISGGIHFIEVTLTMPDSIYILEKAKQRYAGTGAVIGAGTVLDAVSARIALLHGADFIVAPSFDTDTAKLCNLYRKAYIPGIQSANDIKDCLASGVDVMKLFPGNQFTKSIIKDLKGPFPQAHFMVTGQINLTSMAEWFKAGAFAVGIGGELTNYSAEEGDLIREKTLQFVEQVKI